MRNALKKQGLGIVEELESGLSHLLQARGFASVEELIGAALDHLAGEGTMPQRPAARPTALRFVFQGDLATDREAKIAALNGLGEGFETDLDIPATGDGAARRVGVVLVQAETPEALTRQIAKVDRSLGRK